jgi:hypothetical protein
VFDKKVEYKIKKSIMELGSESYTYIDGLMEVELEPKETLLFEVIL